VPGERIVGITYRGQGVVVHAIDCPALEEFEEQPERWVDLHWQAGRHAAVNTSAWKSPSPTTRACWGASAP
jgi:guanosine-3',5'-bis(diphosphate) 3'-pyrophosphohydrolase